MTNTTIKREVDKTFLGLKIYEARTTLGMTQSQLAEKLDVCDRLIYDYESGKKLPGTDKLVLLSLVLHLSLDGILRLKA